MRRFRVTFRLTDYRDDDETPDYVKWVLGEEFRKEGFAVSRITVEQEEARDKAIEAEEE
jgi:hypothetical protein